MLESGAMFEIRLQTYWGDADAAGIVFFPNYFKFVAQAEEEFYRALGMFKEKLLDKHKVMVPRVEAFAKFSHPIRNGAAIRVRLTPSFPGEKALRYDFEILADKEMDKGSDKGPLVISQGYITAVCVDRQTFEPMAFPEEVRSRILSTPST